MALFACHQETARKRRSPRKSKEKKIRNVSLQENDLNDSRPCMIEARAFWL